MDGIVKRLITDKGFGFIRNSEGKEFFFHQSALKNCKFDELREGNEVTFEDSENSKGLRAEDIYVV